MRGYAGVITIAGDSVLLVQEPDFFTGEALWTTPSGKIEDGETPEEAAVREVAEEAGCHLRTADLDLVATASVTLRSDQLSASWNFVAFIDDRRLRPGEDPDRLVTDARWFGRNEALEHLAALPYSPKREPAMRYLTTGVRGLQWTFELVDPQAPIPDFRWQEPRHA